MLLQQHRCLHERQSQQQQRRKLHCCRGTKQPYLSKSGAVTSRTGNRLPDRAYQAARHRWTACIAPHSTGAAPSLRPWCWPVAQQGCQRLPVRLGSLQGCCPVPPLKWALPKHRQPAAECTECKRRHSRCHRRRFLHR